MRFKNMVAILFMLGLTMSIFAYGQCDEYGKKHGHWEEYEERMEEFWKLIESKEKIQLIGELIIANRVLPELKVGNDVYKVLVPPYYVATLEIDEGTEVFIEGVILRVKKDVNTRTLKEGEEVLVVTKAVIDGKEYTPEENLEGCRGPHRGMANKGFPHKGFHGHGAFEPLTGIFE